MRPILLEEHRKNDWTLKLYSDGTLFLFSHHRRRRNQAHRFYWKDTLHGLPIYVAQMVNDMYSAHQDDPHLHLEETNP